jgi:SepF-like predicted cell division protein (DUF552 family)
MAYNVKFLKGTAAQYAAASKDINTFYYVDEKDLYLGEIKISNAADLAAAIERISANETNIGKIADLKTTDKASLVAALNEIKVAVDALGGDTGSIAQQIEAITGKLADLTTTEKGSLVGAINEVVSTVASNKDAAAITITTDTTTDGMAKSYTVKQGDTKITTIDIPKDMVVESGKVVVNPEGQEAGTYIELTLANAASDKLYINVGKLVDIYTAAQNASQVQLTIDSSTREISASIVAGSIGTTEITDSAIVTAKIADKNVTLDKLADAVQTSLGKADSALQSKDIATGGDNGTISVSGTDVAVKGLASAAYAETTDFDAAGSAGTAETNAKSYADGLAKNYDAAGAASTAEQNAKDYADGLASNYDAAGSATTAESNSKAYTDEALTWGTIAE